MSWLRRSHSTQCPGPSDQTEQAAPVSAITLLVPPAEEQAAYSRGAAWCPELPWLVPAGSPAPLHRFRRWFDPAIPHIDEGTPRQRHQQAYEWAARYRRPLPDLLVVLDEAANTPTRWPPDVASTCSGLGMLLVTIWQSKAQIEAADGTLADAVLTNHGTKIFFAGVSDQTCRPWTTRVAWPATKKCAPRRCPQTSAVATA
ncbi:MAG: TraM recognition domain-containing protein [Acidimicrobiales bacterium]